MPDRIAFYSYAHVPWIKGGGQRKFTEKDLPKDAEKRALYELGKKMFEAQGLVEIGMDHFAQPEDELSLSLKSGKLHRNFMGYSASHTSLMIGLGASSIGDAWTVFGQNLKKVEDYKAALEKNELPIYRGHILTKEELVVRQHILDLMCQFKTTFSNSYFNNWPKERLQQLQELEEDDIITIKNAELKVTEKGQAFVRNVCMVFDDLLWNNQPQTAVFSTTI